VCCFLKRYVKESKARLSHLAHVATKNDKYRPETCCIVGNYYRWVGRRITQHTRILKLLLGAYTHSFLCSSWIMVAARSLRENKSGTFSAPPRQIFRLPLHSLSLSSTATSLRQPAYSNASLKAQHHKAVLYFQRALKLNRRFLAAWTLMGHEFVRPRRPRPTTPFPVISSFRVLWFIEPCFVSK
jgi:hypothetical protein